MKFAILIGDGMADFPVRQLGNRTPLEFARTPFLDRIAREGAGGRARTVPKGLKPGSDVANLSILGVNPKAHYPGRGPLEAVSKGIPVGEDEMVFRCNLVTTAEGIMVDYSAGHIPQEEASILIQALNDAFSQDGLRFYAGVSYRNLLVVPKEAVDSGMGHLRCVPPHDIQGRPLEPNLPSGRGAFFLRDVMARAGKVLRAHEVNAIRIDLGENPATAAWIWGGGERAALPDFEETWGLKGAAISAVDLIWGIARALGMDVIEVPGATGYFDTDYAAKGSYALRTLEDHDLVFVHVEAPDEAGHQGSLKEKIRAIENFDEKVVGQVLDGIGKFGEYRILVMPDHATPLSRRTHVADPVPFAMCGAGVEADRMTAFTEGAARKGSMGLVEGYRVIERFIRSRRGAGKVSVSKREAC